MGSLPEFGSLASIIGIIACVVVGYLIVSWLIDFVRDKSAFNKRGKGKGDFLPEDQGADFRRPDRKKDQFR